jgi:sulfite reductase (NADPH) hemoprotein beta-component
MSNEVKLSEVEHIKIKSNYLRGTIVESLENPITGALHEDDVQLIKFHGSYQQHDRETESERKKQKLEPLYSFMIRVKLPGGITTPAQWLAIDNLSDKYGNSTIKLTTRQAYQLHAIFKKHLKPSIKEINDALMTTIAACGDVNRNIMNSVNPHESDVHHEVHELIQVLGDRLDPKTTAYHEIWLDKKLVSGVEDEEPIYGLTYLPRKFKIAFAVPPQNDSDVYTNDLGFVAIEKNGALTGFNVLVGGGMGMTFGRKDTFPRLANDIGYIPKDKLIQVAEEIVKIQRDNGNRSDRKLSRFKYTIEKLGIDGFKTELKNRLGFELEPSHKFLFTGNGDKYGWLKGIDNKWYLTLLVEGGRVKGELKTALAEVAKIHKGDFRLTGNQNLIVGKVEESDKKAIDAILAKHIPYPQENISGLRRLSIACVALNTCSLAHAEAERYLPSLITKLEKVVGDHGLYQDDIVIRMTGCPNGCGRPFVAEIGFVGKSLGKYNLYLGGGFNGQRLNKLYKETLDETQIIDELTPMIASYAKLRNQDERFGDFLIRQGIIKETVEGKNFHE